MQPTKEWLEKWEKVKDKLQPSSNLEDYFTLKEIAGKELDVLDIGPCSIPTGEFLVRDPLVYLIFRIIFITFFKKFCKIIIISISIRIFFYPFFSKITE